MPQVSKKEYQISGARRALIGRSNLFDLTNAHRFAPDTKQRQMRWDDIVLEVSKLMDQSAAEEAAKNGKTDIA